MLRYTDVFVPGGFPEHTYHSRTSLNLENKLKEVFDRLNKLVVVTGHTKSGKTVLVRKIIPREEGVWIDGGTIGSQEDFWGFLAEQLELFQTTELEDTAAESSQLEGSATIGGNLVLKGEVTTKGVLEEKSGKSIRRSRTTTPKIAALQAISKTRTPLVIDDFHYIPKDLQGTLIRALKPLIFDGLPVIIIAIPHRRYDAVKVEREMAGRMHSVSIPLWSQDELSFIPQTGFNLLGSRLSSRTLDELAMQSIGSPHLMQEFCRTLCKKLESSGALVAGEITTDDKQIKEVFSDTAETIGRPIFEKLARGPRQRSDRIPRTLKSGAQVDIYQLVLHALAHEHPDLVTLEYEQLRAAIKAICAEEIPQLHEVTRVLKYMSAIAATDQSSTPVVDFDDEEKRLHITDPFFAFYLRWGRLDS